MGLVIAFSGRMRSGKTSLSCELSRRLSWPRVAFGEYVRKEIKRAGGNPDCRQLLQDYGQRRVENDLEGFCRSVLAQAELGNSTNLIVDGIRHTKVLETIRRLCVPMRTILVYVDCSDKTRYLRTNDLATSEDTFIQQDQHSVEDETGNTLRNLADKIVDGESDTADTAQPIIDLIYDWSGGSDFKP